MVGLIYIDGDLRVGGIVEGEVEATGDVEIDDMARVKASVAARQVSIRGQVSGPVVARKRLVVSKSGSLIGDVRVPRLVVQDGATFSGNVSMTTDADMPPKPVVEARPVEVPVGVVDAPAVVEVPAPVEVPKPQAPKVASAPPKPAAAPRDGGAAKLVRTASKDGRGAKAKTPPPAKGKAKRR